MFSYVWINIGIYGMYGYVWVCMGMYGYIMVCIDMCGLVIIYKGIYRFIWVNVLYIKYSISYCQIF